MKADKKLEKLGIKFEEVVQDKPTKSCDDAAKQRGLNTNQIVKSLIIESRDKNFHILLPGDRTLSESKFGSEYRMVPPEQSKEITGFESGTVHPFSTKLQHIVDERIFENDEVSHTVGETKRGVIIDTSSFEDALEKADFSFEVRDIAVSEQEDFTQLKEKGLEEEKAKFVVNNGYRSSYLALHNTYQDSNILTLLKEFGREDLKPDVDLADEILERAESQTHIQRLVSKYSETGELPEKEEFDLQDSVSSVIDDNPEAVKDFENGQDSAVNYLIGQLMQYTNGRADAGKARELILEELG